MYLLFASLVTYPVYTSLGTIKTQFLSEFICGVGPMKFVGRTKEDSSVFVMSPRTVLSQIVQYFSTLNIYYLSYTVTYSKNLALVAKTESRPLYSKELLGLLNSNKQAVSQKY